MKRLMWLLALTLVAAPAFAQDPEEALRELGMGAIFSGGDLAVRDLDRVLDPVQQLKRFFIEAKLPLTTDQQKRLQGIVDGQQQAMHTSGQTDQATARMNIEFMRKINGVLTEEQQVTWRRFRTEQIMMRGGYPALQLIMENAKLPFSADQETKARAVYNDFIQQTAQMNTDSKGAPDRAVLDKLETEALGKVVRLLTPEQRRALIAARSLNAGSKPTKRP